MSGDYWPRLRSARVVFSLLTDDIVAHSTIVWNSPTILHGARLFSNLGLNDNKV